jgi:hypothetical protein
MPTRRYHRFRRVRPRPSTPDILRGRDRSVPRCRLRSSPSPLLAQIPASATPRLKLRASSSISRSRATVPSTLTSQDMLCLYYPVMHTYHGQCRRIGRRSKLTGRKSMRRSAESPRSFPATFIATVFRAPISTSHLMAWASDRR